MVRFSSHMINDAVSDRHANSRWDETCGAALCMESSSLTIPQIQVLE
jgi:hypothetical protein